MAFCGAADPQARRYQTILEAFHDVLTAEAIKQAKAEGALGGPGGPNIFNVLFGAEGASVGGGGGAGLWGASVPPAGHGSTTASARGAEIQQADPGGLDGLCFLAGLGTTGNDRWMNGVLGTEGMTDADKIWWPEAQDSFVSTVGVQLPLYGLMEPT